MYYFLKICKYWKLRNDCHSVLVVFLLSVLLSIVHALCFLLNWILMIKLHFSFPKRFFYDRSNLKFVTFN
jgi:hypothetical protein